MAGEVWEGEIALIRQLCATHKVSEETAALMMVIHELNLTGLNQADHLLGVDINKKLDSILKRLEAIEAKVR